MLEKGVMFTALLFSTLSGFLLFGQDASAGGTTEYCDSSAIVYCGCYDNGGTVCAGSTLAQYVSCTTKVGPACKAARKYPCPPAGTGYVGYGTCAGGYTPTNFPCSGPELGSC